MAHRYIITVDVGTSSTKTGLWDDAGKLIAETSQAYPLHRPDPLWAEIDGGVWWEAVCTTIRHVIATSGVDPRLVAGIGVDGVLALAHPERQPRVEERDDGALFLEWRPLNPDGSEHRSANPVTCSSSTDSAQPREVLGA